MYRAEPSREKNSVTRSTYILNKYIGNHLRQLIRTLNMYSEKIKARATDISYFPGNTFSRILVHQKNFGLILHEVFMLEYLYCQGM